MSLSNQDSGTQRAVPPFSVRHALCAGVPWVPVPTVGAVTGHRAGGTRRGTLRRRRVVLVPPATLRIQPPSNGPPTAAAAAAAAADSDTGAPRDRLNHPPSEQSTSRAAPSRRVVRLQLRVHCPRLGATESQRESRNHDFGRLLRLTGEHATEPVTSRD